MFWTCKGQLGLERHGARTLPGLCARIAIRLLTLAAGLWHNRMIGQPGRPLTRLYPLECHLTEPRAAEAREPDEPLTERELDVARLVAQGQTNAEIGAELFISAGTVKTHIANIQRKLGTRNRVGIAAWAWNTGQAGP